VIECRAQRGECTLQKENMKYLGIFAAGVLAVACSSGSTTPAASAASIDRASSTPSNSDFAPVANDGTASAASAQSATQTGTHKAVTTSPSTPAVTPPGSPAPTVSNAAASPAQQPSSGAAPDNSGVNARDKDGKALTPMDQGGSEADRKITQQIRQAVMKDGSLSFNAKNVKIITVNGKVTLRGPVKTAAERTAIEAAAKSAAGVNQVDNQLEVKN